jgi:hypothetical protein
VLSADVVVSGPLALIDGFELAVAIDVHDATPDAVLAKLTGTAGALLASRS